MYHNKSSVHIKLRFAGKCDRNNLPSDDFDFSSGVFNSKSLFSITVIFVRLLSLEKLIASGCKATIGRKRFYV